MFDSFFLIKKNIHATTFSELSQDFPESRSFAFSLYQACTQNSAYFWTKSRHPHCHKE